MSGPNAAALFLLILAISCGVVFVIIPTLYQNWKKAHPSR